MAVPFLWVGAGVITLLAGAKYSKDQFLGDSVSTMPGQGEKSVTPINGSIVSCGVYEVFDHTGIWVDGNIIELKGNGLVRGISPQRFLENRSGEQIFIACDQHHQPLAHLSTAKRATEQLFNYSQYDVIHNNCHRFVWQCVSGNAEAVTRFSLFNTKISEHYAEQIHWHQANID
jgi:hypothetical protein